MSQPIPGPGFVMWTPETPGRQGVLRAGRQLIGKEFSNPNFTLRLTREDRLAWWMKQRLDVTVSKLMAGMALAYVAGEAHPILQVEGARAQHGTGNSSRVKEGDKSYLVGTEAAHVGIGTLTVSVGGQAATVQAHHDLLALAARARIPRREIPAEFAAYGRLIAFGLANDAATVLVPAFFNQTEGVQERVKQHLMLGLRPSDISSKPELLERDMIAVAERAVHFLSGNERFVIRPIDERLRDLKDSPEKEYLQYPRDEGENRIFHGKESELLEALKGEAKESRSQFNTDLNTLHQDIRGRAQEVAALADAAKAEKSSAEGGG